MKRKDRCWDYVKEVEVEEKGEMKKKARCIFCSETFCPGNIKRLKYHLAGTPGRGIKPCAYAPSHVRQQAEEGNKIVKIAASPSTASGILSEGFPQYSVSQTKAEARGESVVSMPQERKYSCEATNNKLARWLLFNNCDFAAVKTGLFVNFIKSLSHCGVEYKLPRPSELGMEFFPEMKKYVDDVKKSWEATGCTIMLDKWSNFIIIMVYSAKGAIFLNIYEISDFLDNGLFCITIEDIGVDRVVQVVANDVQVFTHVEAMLKSKYPGIYLIRCVAHEIHSFLKAIYDQVGWVHITIDEAISIVRYMHADTRILSLVKQFIGNKGLSHCCLDKFASSYKMLQSVLDNKDRLQKLVASENWFLLDNNRNEEAMKVVDMIQNAKFWSEVQEVMNVMEPFIQVLCLVESDGSTSGYLHEAMEMAREKIEVKYSNDRTKYEKILELFMERRGNDTIIHPIHPAAAFLNPDYMWRRDFEWSEELSQGMNFVLKTLVTHEEKTGFVEETMRYRNKTPKVFNELATELMKSHNLCEWWSCCGSSLPILQKHATRILGQTCRSTSYLNPSVFTLISQRKKMNKATSETWYNLLYVTLNTMLMEKFTTIEEQNKRWIDLQNCNEMPEYLDSKQGWEDGTSNIDGKDEINSCCPNEKVMGDEAIVEKLIPFVQSLMCFTIEGTRMHQFLQSIISCVQQPPQFELEGGSWNMTTTQTFPLVKDGGNKQMHIQSSLDQTVDHGIVPIALREDEAKDPCSVAGPSRIEYYPAYGSTGLIPGANQSLIESLIKDLFPGSINYGDNYSVIHESYGTDKL